MPWSLTEVPSFHYIVLVLEISKLVYIERFSTPNITRIMLKRQCFNSQIVPLQLSVGTRV